MLYAAATRVPAALPILSALPTRTRAPVRFHFQALKPSSERPFDAHVGGVPRSYGTSGASNSDAWLVDSLNRQLAEKRDLLRSEEYDDPHSYAADSLRRQIADLERRIREIQPHD